METSEIKETVICAMVSDMTWVLSHGEGDGLSWKGKKSELIEWVYEVANTGQLLDEDGNRPTKSRLLCVVSAILHCPLPSNPRSAYRKVLQTESTFYSRRLPIADRYAHMLSHGEQRPILRFIREEK